jgi:glutamine synthetase
MLGTVPHVESSHDLASAETAQTFAPFFDDLWAACETQSIPISGYGHESATGQYEVNLRPGAPLAQADAVFRFKRLAREIARRHGCLATFMAKPYLGEPGNGMHWHVSLSDAQGQNAFTAADGSAHARMANFIGGWQASAAGAMALLAPYAHSYLRIARPDASPAIADWGFDDRRVAFRIPQSDPANRRLEHRLPGGDANPYLALALMLGSGLIGMQQERKPSAARVNGPHSPATPLPQNLDDALVALENCPLLEEVFGAGFIGLYAMVKRHELTEQAADADFALRHLLARS